MIFISFACIQDGANSNATPKRSQLLPDMCFARSVTLVLGPEVCVILLSSYLVTRQAALLGNTLQDGMLRILTSMIYISKLCNRHFEIIIARGT